MHGLSGLVCFERKKLIISEGNEERRGRIYPHFSLLIITIKNKLKTSVSSQNERHQSSFPNYLIEAINSIIKRKIPITANRNL